MYGACDRKARSLPSFPEGLVAAALRLGRHHLEGRWVHHAAVVAARVPRRRRGLHVARLHRRRLHVRLPGRGRRVRCLADRATETRESTHAVSSAVSKAGLAEEKQVSGARGGSPYLSRAPAAGCSSSSSVLDRAIDREAGSRRGATKTRRGSWVGPGTASAMLARARVYIGKRGERVGIDTDTGLVSS